LVPAAAVIPALSVYEKVVAFKTFVARESLMRKFKLLFQLFLIMD